MPQFEHSGQITLAPSRQGGGKSGGGGNRTRRQFPLHGAYVAPRTPTEQKLAEIWRRAFDMDQVGIADPYEDLGGDSLLAASIFAEIEQTFQITVPMSTLIHAPTIEQLAPRVDALVSLVFTRA